MLRTGAPQHPDARMFKHGRAHTGRNPGPEIAVSPLEAECLPLAALPRPVALSHSHRAGAKLWRAQLPLPFSHLPGTQVLLSDPRDPGAALCSGLDWRALCPLAWGLSSVLASAELILPVRSRGRTD